jgi:hypothetical protein
VPIIDPTHHKADLRAALSNAGWDVERIEGLPSAWWINELWRLQSRWRPVGRELWLTFLGDPMEMADPPKRVTGIAVGEAPAADRFGRDLDCFDLSLNWPDEKARILEFLSDCRTPNEIESS